MAGGKKPKAGGAKQSRKRKDPTPASGEQVPSNPPALNGQIIPPGMDPQVPSPPRAKTLEDQIAEQLAPDEAKAAIAICERLATEAKSIGDIAAAVFGLVDDGQGHHAAKCKFYRLKVRSAALASLYARARESRADMLVDEIIEIADAPLPDKSDAVGLKAEVEHRRLKVDSRKWAAGKFNRLLYSDDPPGVTINNTVNADGGASALEEIRLRLARKRKVLELGSDKSNGPGDDRPGPDP